MDIISPLFTEETVNDLDLVFVGGFRDSITLRADDTVFHDAHYIIVTVAKPPETITIHRDNVLVERNRTRVIKWPIKGSPIVGAQSQNPIAD